jgi:hypothetical protein
MKYVTNFEVRRTVEEIIATYREKETEIPCTYIELMKTVGLRMTRYCMHRARRERGNPKRSKKRNSEANTGNNFPNP